jgi:hypothetical protein
LSVWQAQKLVNGLCTDGLLAANAISKLGLMVVDVREEDKRKQQQQQQQQSKKVRSLAERLPLRLRGQFVLVVCHRRRASGSRATAVAK